MHSVKALVLTIYFLVVAFIPCIAAGESFRVPARDEVLRPLKQQPPRLISDTRLKSIEGFIAEDDLAKKIWLSNLEFAGDILKKKPLIYEKPDGRRLLKVSKAALERLRSLSLCYRILGDKKYADRAWQPP